ncbi:MAG TPA: hypothetical protein PLK12_02700 [Prolixibacteraceae bacterium]|nr:hypothetical protein [Prolixibacteraceae bacterium]
MKLERISFWAAGWILLFFLPSCIDIPVNDNPGNEEEENEEVVDDEGGVESNWKFLAQVNREDAGWGFYFYQNLEVDTKGNAYLLYQPQYSKTGGGQGYAAVITDSAQYTIEEFFSMVSVIETDMHKDVLYAAYMHYVEGFPEIDMVKRENGNWSGISGEIVEDYCDDEFDLAISPSGDLYVAYSETKDLFDGAGKLTVKKYVSGSWQTLGSPGFSDSLCSHIHLAVGNDNVPYVYYREVGYSDKKSRKAIVQYFNGSEWVKCNTYISASEEIQSMSIAMLGNKPFIACSESDTNKSYVRYWNGSEWKDTAGSLPYMLQTVLQTFNDELYVAFRNSEDSNYIYLSKRIDSGWEAIENDGIKHHVSTSTESIDFRVTAEGIYLLDVSSAKVVYYPF